MSAARQRRTALVPLIAALVLLGARPESVRAQITVVINNLDGAGEGFNDPTAIAPTGGNSANTVGQARLNVFKYAASIWGARLASNAASPVVVQVDARFDPLTCTANSGVLGSAGAMSLHRDFPNAPLTATWYPQALANSLAGVDLNPTASDISAKFNSSLDTAACLGATTWYYGLDANPPAGDVDLASVVVHELGHGLGFQTFVDLSTGTKASGIDDAFMVRLERHGATPNTYPAMTDAQRVAASISEPNLQWLGTRADTAAAGLLTAGFSSGHVLLYGPNPAEPGSSVSHFSVALTPNQVMEPSYFGPKHDPGLAVEVLRDLGWGTPTDIDSDGILTVSDNCPRVGNTNQLDSDSDAVGNVCDNCPFKSNSNQLDTDHNGIGDACETVAAVPATPRWSTLMHAACLLLIGGATMRRKRVLLSR